MDQYLSLHFPKRVANYIANKNSI